MRDALSARAHAFKREESKCDIGDVGISDKGREECPPWEGLESLLGENCEGNATQDTTQHHVRAC
jgi:hypothetical protein